MTDPGSEMLTIAIVVGGCLLATLLRRGLGNCHAALVALGGLVGAVWHKPFDADAVKAHLAGQVQQISRDGLLRARPRHSGDAQVDAATDALIVRRSLDALRSTHEGQRARRLTQAGAAVGTLLAAAELAPVAGLAGTLVSLSHLPADGIDRAAYLVAIGMAVHATLYGLMVAHLVMSPLARAVERVALAEEADRQAIIDWLSERLDPVCPDGQESGHHPGPYSAGRRVRHG